MNQFNPWGDYARLQQLTDSRKLDTKAWAAEEQANEFLDAVANKTLKATPNAREAWMNNLATNRAKKHRRRAALLHQHQRKLPAWSLSEAHDAAVQNEDVSSVRRHTTPEEWRLLSALAIGHDYDTLAKANDCTVSALKTRVSRCRRRLLNVISSAG